MKQHHRILVMLTAAALLCGCTPQTSDAPAVTDVTTTDKTTDQTDITTLADQTDQTTITNQTAETDQTAGTDQTAQTTITEQPAPTDSTAPTDTAAQTDVTETAAQTAVTDAVPGDLDIDIQALFVPGASAALSGKGYVFARDGLNLRDKPSSAGKKITTLKHGTEVTVKSVTNAKKTDDYGAQCWFAVEAGGKSGYVSAEFVALSCTDAPDSLTEMQQAALGIVLFQQGRKLRDYFFQEGGIRATKIAKQPVGDEYYALEPKTLTLDQIKQDYDKYFAVEIWGGLDPVYKKQNGQLYIQPVVPENPYTDHELLTKITDVTADSITYCMHTQWYTEGEFVMFRENNGVTEAPFIIKYLGGAWKIAEFTANL